MRLKEESRGHPRLGRNGGANPANPLTNIVPLATMRGQWSGGTTRVPPEGRSENPPGALDDRTWITLVEWLLRLGPETFEQIVLAVRLERRFENRPTMEQSKAAQPTARSRR